MQSEKPNNSCTHSIALKKRNASICARAALAYELVSTMVIIQAVPLSEEPISLVFTLLTSFFYGWGIDDAFNKIFIDRTKHWKRIGL